MSPILPTEILSLIIEACMEPYSITITYDEIEKIIAGITPNFYPRIIGLPDVTNLKLTNKSFYGMTMTHLGAHFNGCLNLGPHPHSFQAERTISMFTNDKKLSWVLPLVLNYNCIISSQENFGLLDLGIARRMPRLFIMNVEYRSILCGFQSVQVAHAANGLLDDVIVEAYRKQEKDCVSPWQDEPYQALRALRRKTPSTRPLQLRIDCFVVLNTTKFIGFQFRLDISTSGEEVVVGRYYPSSEAIPGD